MYFPSPLPTTRLSLSTSFLPTGPSPASKTQVYKTPGRPAKGKFKESLGGVQEEEGEEILSIVRGPEVDDNGQRLSGRTLWASLGREEVSVWSSRVRSDPSLRPLPLTKLSIAAESRSRQTSSFPSFPSHPRLERLAVFPRSLSHRVDYHNRPSPHLHDCAHRKRRGDPNEEKRRSLRPAWRRKGEGGMAGWSGRGRRTGRDRIEERGGTRDGGWRRCWLVRSFLSVLPPLLSAHTCSTASASLRPTYSSVFSTHPLFASSLSLPLLFQKRPLSPASLSSTSSLHRRTTPLQIPCIPTLLRTGLVITGKAQPGKGCRPD